MEEQAILPSQKKGLFLVVSAPAGTGKNTLVDMLKKEFSNIVESISYTTRDPRPEEVDGREYFFVSKENFLEMKNRGDFLESAEVFGNFYGTSKKWIEETRSEGKHVVLVIDTQGAMQLRKTVPGVFIFIMPPSLEELKKRMLKRNADGIEEIEKRLSIASEEIKLSSYYDYNFVNDDLDLAYDVLRSIVVAEAHKVRS